MINDGKLRGLSDLVNGASEIEFRNALNHVVDNINEPRCDGRAARKINVCISFHPDPRTQTVNIEVDTTVKLSKRANRRTTAFVGKGNDGQLGLFTEDPAQVKMFKSLAESLKYNKQGEAKVNE